MAESLDDDRGESYNNASCVAPSKYAVPRISLPQPHNHESDSHGNEPQSHVDQRKYRHLADSTPFWRRRGATRNFLKTQFFLGMFGAYFIHIWKCLLRDDGNQANVQTGLWVGKPNSGEESYFSGYRVYQDLAWFRVADKPRVERHYFNYAVEDR